MQHDEFIGYVQDRADLDSRGAAEEATRAVLTTLAERLGGGEPSDLAAQLPPEIGAHLRETEAAQDGGGERFDVDEFIQRVMERSSTRIDGPGARHRIHGVLSVIRDAVSPGEFDDLSGQLPEGYLEAFGVG